MDFFNFFKTAGAKDSKVEESKVENSNTSYPRPTKFIQFGCWNNTAGDNDTQKILTAVKEETIDFLLVSGDNYYPDKIKTTNAETGKTIKTKIIDTKNLNEGISLLPTNVPVYMILGNHDLETSTADGKNIIKKRPLESGAEVKDLADEGAGECSIITQEMDMVDAINKTANAKIDYVFFKSIAIGTDTLLCMFDSDVFLHYEEAISYIPCYKKFVDKTPEGGEEAKQILDRPKSTEEERKEMVDALRNNIKQQFIDSIQKFKTAHGNIKYFIFSGHQPISGIAFKEKKDKARKGSATAEPKKPTPPKGCKVMYEIYATIAPTLHSIFTECGGNKTEYYYLCADHHSFQRGTIEIAFQPKTDDAKSDSADAKSDSADAKSDSADATDKPDANTMIIHQYITGTGGGKLDQEIPLEGNCTDPKDTITGANIDSTTKSTCKYIFGKNERKHGFLLCTVPASGEPTFDFKETKTTPVIGEEKLAEADTKTENSKAVGVIGTGRKRRASSRPTRKQKRTRPGKRNPTRRR